MWHIRPSIIQVVDVAIALTRKSSDIHTEGKGLHKLYLCKICDPRFSFSKMISGKIMKSFHILSLLFIKSVKIFIALKMLFCLIFKQRRRDNILYVAVYR